MKYFEKIDGLRCAAIMLVLIEHFGGIIGDKFSAGYYGVDLFFVISGFLITSILYDSKNNTFSTSYKKFIGRRILRIFPIYYLTILVLWLVQLDTIHTYISYFLTYSFNYALISYNLPNTPVNHFWSLCVEEQFYLFWPILILLLRKNDKILISIIVIIITIGFSQMTFGLVEEINKYNLVNLLTRMGSLGTGALGAILIKTDNLPHNLLKKRWLEYLVLCVLIFSLITHYRSKYILFAFCSLYLVIKAAYYEFSLDLLNRFLSNKKILQIGTISYGIYIYHLPISYYFTTYIFDPIWLNINFDNLHSLKILRWNSWIIKLPLYSILSYLLAFFSFKYIERPILSLKDKLFKY